MFVLIILVLLIIAVLVLIYRMHGAKLTLFALGSFIVGLLLSHFLTNV